MDVVLRWWLNEKGDTMSWQRFWSLFLAVHVVGLSIVMFGAGFHFFAVILGILLLFPGIIPTVPWAISSTPLSALVAFVLTITINVPFWIAVLRPMPAMQPKGSPGRDRGLRNGATSQPMTRGVRDRSRVAAY
jgi:hypothetical protein